MVYKFTTTMTRSSIAKKVPWSGKAYGEGRISATKHDFQCRAIRLGQKPKYSDGQALNARLVPAEFNRMRPIKNAPSIPGENDDTSDVVLVTKLFQRDVRTTIYYARRLRNSRCNYYICKEEH